MNEKSTWEQRRLNDVWAKVNPVGQGVFDVWILGAWLWAKVLGPVEPGRKFMIVKDDEFRSPLILG